MHSTESHVVRALRTLGHDVDMLQEDDPVAWALLRNDVKADLLLWVHTGGFPPITEAAQTAVIDQFRDRNSSPVVGVHLDRWWGLPREDQITKQHKAFFFAPDILYTADGGHDKKWRDAGIIHRWFPPAVSEPECEPGILAPIYTADVAFVGSWQGGYHPEWPHRQQLVDHLKALRKKLYIDVKFWPQPGYPAIRGVRLRALYASTKVLVGDSCLVPHTNGQPIAFYNSDRIPETLGRGGYLIHPRVKGVTDATLYTEGEHLACWTLDDWDELESKITDALQDPERTAEIAQAGRRHVLAHHTYEIRMADLLAELHTEGMV